MAAPSIAFKPSHDIHLMRGQSIQIVNEFNGYPCLLRLDGEDAPGYVDDHSSIEYFFSFSFDEDLSHDFGLHINHINKASAKPDVIIELLADEPAAKNNQLRNFYLRADTIDTDLDADDAGYLKSTLIRIHIHNEVKDFWLSPAGLNIYKDTSVRFSPRVLYDDGEVAIFYPDKIKQYHILPAIDIQYSFSSPLITLSATDKIRCTATLPSILSDAIAKLQFGTTEFTDTALIIYSDKLFKPDTMFAELVSASGSPGASRLQDVPNVLFVPDGFLPGQREMFKNYVENYVKDLMSGKITSPFNILKGSINFWRLFIPSLESGLSTYGHYSVNKKNMECRPIPFAENSKDIPVRKWEIEHLLFHVGLPAVHEGTMSTDDIKSRWEKTTLLTEDEISDIKSELIKKWKALALRKLPNLKNTAFSVSMDDYTSAIEDHDEELIDFDEERFDRRHLDELFDSMQDSKGNRIGSVFKYLPSLNRGKDFDNIIVLCASKYGRAVNAEGYMFSTLGDGVIKLNGNIEDHKIKIADTVLPKELEIARKKTITHELCHSFGLGDEYGESLDDKYNHKPADKVPSSYAVADEDIHNLDEYSNIQTWRDLQVKIAGTDKSQIQPYRIKWRYHRVQVCGLVQQVSIENNHLMLQLSKDHLKEFDASKKIIIRKRQASHKEYYITDPHTHQALALIIQPMPNGTRDMRDMIFSVNADKTVIVIDPIDQHTFNVLPLLPDQLVAGKTIEIKKRIRQGPIQNINRIQDEVPTQLEKSLSPPLDIVFIDEANSRMAVDIIGMNIADDLKFKSNDEVLLVYHPLPVENDPVAADYPYYEIISQKVLNHLLPNPQAFNAKGDGTEIIDNDNISKISPLLVPCCSRNKHQVVGLYAGGYRYHSKIYHPTARCMMRQGLINRKYTELCAVCRYTLVNLINPLKFKEFDDDYMKRKIYP